MKNEMDSPEQTEIFHLRLDVDDRQESIEIVYVICKKLLKIKNAEQKEYITALEHILFHITEFIE